MCGAECERSRCESPSIERADGRRKSWTKSVLDGLNTNSMFIYRADGYAGPSVRRERKEIYALSTRVKS